MLTECSGIMAHVSTMMVRPGVRRLSHCSGVIVVPFLLVMRGSDSLKTLSPKRLRIVR